jgi:SAM-dependent methyltransferase
MPDYFLSEADRAQRARLDSVAASADQGTTRILDALDVAAGWNCAEVGAGTGTIATWLIERVGPTGRVTATDLDTRWLDSLAFANLEVRRHDVASDPLGDNEFDLVHVRNVLCHVVERDRAIANLVAAVRPGGWLCVEDIDFLGAGVSFPRSEVFERFNAATAELVARAGGDPYFGRKILSALLDAGMVSTGVDVRDLRSSEEAILANADAIGPVAVAAGLLSTAEIHALRGEDPTAFRYSPRFVAAWGQKPPADTTG